MAFSRIGVKTLRPKAVGWTELVRPLDHGLARHEAAYTGLTIGPLIREQNIHDKPQVFPKGCNAAVGAAPPIVLPPRRGDGVENVNAYKDISRMKLQVSATFLSN